MDPASAAQLLAQYGSIAGLVFVTMGFLFGFVLSKGHHEEIVSLWRGRLDDAESRCKDLASENAQLRQAMMLSNSQANRATGALAHVVGGGELERR
jgi:hypothetical protein